MVTQIIIEISFHINAYASFYTNLSIMYKISKSPNYMANVNRSIKHIKLNIPNTKITLNKQQEIMFIVCVESNPQNKISTP